MTAMPTAFARAALVAALLVVTGCTDGPQQPTDMVDDRSTAPRYLSDTQETLSPQLIEEDVIGDAPAADARGNGALTTATRPLVADFGAIAGRWAADAETCEAEGTVLTLSSTRFESPDRQCDISDAIDAGGGSITATLSCEGGAAEGTAVALVRLEPRGDGLAVRFVGDDNPARSYTRCP